MDKLCDRETRQEFQVKIGGAFEHLLELGDRPVDELCLDFKETTNEKVVGFRRRKQVVSPTSVLARECEEKRKACTEYLKNTSHAEKLETSRNKNRLMKKAIRTHERKQLEEKIQVMEEDFKKNNLHNLF